MADTIKTTRTLGIIVQGMKATSLDTLTTVTLKIPNPKTTLVESDFTTDIKDFFQAAAVATGKIDASNPETASKLAVTGAYTENVNTVSLDLTPTS